MHVSVHDQKLVSITHSGDDRGNLCVIEGERDADFPIRRVYYIYGTRAGVARGFHAHKALRQLAVCVAGRCTMVLDDGRERRNVVLDRPTLGTTDWAHDLARDARLLRRCGTHGAGGSALYRGGLPTRLRHVPYPGARVVTADVPFLALAPIYEELRGEIDAAALRVLHSGWFVGGPENERFESAFAAYVGASHTIGVGNGLDALHLTLRAMDVGPGDEVIVASNSFIATMLAVSMTGATPVMVEPDPTTYNLDPARIEEVITPRTKVLLPTHLYGQPANLNPLIAIARHHKLRLVEDAAQAHGARYRGTRVGAHGDAVCWSFYPSKNLGAAGDGGGVTTNDTALATRIRTLGNYGSAERYVNIEKGVNSRLDPIHAAVMSVKLPHLDAWNARRTRIATRYLKELRGCNLVLPHIPDWADPVWHLFTVHTPRRDELRAALAADGIGTQIHYPIPPHRQQAYAELGLSKGTFPIAERLAAETLSLPIGPHLADADVGRVIDAVQRWAKA